jgi:hypothetical protein
VTATRHPTGIRVIRRESTCEFGPGDNEADLLVSLAREIAAERIDDVQTIVVDWRDDGCYLCVHSNSYVLLREIGTSH